MRPVSVQFPINQPFGSMKTQGVVGNIKAVGTDAYYVALYGNYQPYGHAGTDFKCPEGTPVYAMASGKVLWADWGTNLPGDESNAGYRKRWYLYKGFPGIVTVIQHAGWVGVYAHLSRAQLNAGDTVTEGQQLGLSGGTGGVAPHLHVEALVDLTYKTGGGLIYGRTNPEPFFGSAAIAPQGSTNPTEEIDMSAEANIIAAIKQETEWADGRFKALKDSVQVAVDHSFRARQVADAIEDDGTRAKVGLIFQMLAQIAPQFRFFKGPNEETLYELEDGKLRGITAAEWKARGEFAPIDLDQETIDKLLKAGDK